MFKLLAESGSTKTDWMMVNDQGERTSFTTAGINPLLLSIEEITDLVEQEVQLIHQSTQIQQVYFYGAGCGNKDAVNRLRVVFQGIFYNAEIEIFPDTLAAARACCAHEPGIVGILGTGANAGFFDGKNQFTPFVPSLGFILGDEGSGNWIGRKLLSDYFYGRMPIGLRDAFLEEYAIDYQEVISRLYRSTAPNAYLASFAPFCHHHFAQPYCTSLIMNGINLFLNRFIDPAILPEGSTVHFAGSVAFAFQESIREQLDTRKLNLGRVVSRPLESLLAFHLDLK
jgi:N-acetylglucosamine kinase-like BadF-type ATPase